VYVQKTDRGESPSRTTYIVKDGVDIMQGNKPAVEIFDDLPPGAASFQSPELLAGVTTITRENISELFSHRNLAFVATLSEDGSPHVTPVWAEMEDDLILINTSEASAKARHVSKDPRVGISLVDQFNPYNMVTIKGRVVKITNEGADEHLQKLAKRYLGIGKYYYRKPKDKRVIIKVKPDKVTGLSGHPAFYFLAYLPRDEK
jgi:PPOX class probable F420-dependent enzyme